MTETEERSPREEALAERRAELEAALESLRPAALVKIWTAPAETVRALLKLRPDKRLHQLSMTAGIGVVFAVCVAGRLGSNVPMSDLLTLTILMGGLAGMTALYLGAEIARRLGQRFGGIGNAVALRCALAWGVAPWAEATLVLGLALVALQGDQLFATWPTGPAAVPFALIGTLAAFSFLWSTRGVVLTIAEVHAIERGQAALTLLGTAGMLLTLAGACALLI